jgi:HlyD family secretion protein
MNSKIKKIIISAVSCVLVIVIIAASVIVYKVNKDKNTELDVVSVSNISTQYWADDTSVTGNVISDYSQELYSDSEKVVKKVYVKEGDTVKIGDKLIAYDKTLLSLDEQSKALELKKIDLQIEDTQEELTKLNNTTPYYPSEDPGTVDEPTPTPQPESKAKLYSKINLDSIPYSGSGTTDDPYKFLCTSDCVISTEFIAKMMGLSAATPEPSPTPAPTQSPDTSSTPEPSDDPEPTSSPEASSSPDPTTPPESGDGSEGDSSQSGSILAGLSFKMLSTKGTLTMPLAMFTTATQNEVNYDKPFCAAFEVRDGDTEYGELIKGWIFDGTKGETGFFNPKIESSEGEEGGINLDDGGDYGGSEIGSGYTSEELKEMISQKEQELSDLKFSKKQGKLDYEKAKLALDNSVVRSEVDGVVKKLTDIETAQSSGDPFMVISGGKGLYIKGTVNESLLGTVNTGDEFTAMSWDTGSSYTGKILKISEYPTDSTDVYSENPNTSNYDFLGYFEDADDLNSGDYLSITFSSQASSVSSNLYVYKAYVRSDSGGSYVLKSVDGIIKKTYISVGKSIWSGQYIEVKNGITGDDYLAFPYGKDARDGVKAKLDDEGGTDK